MLVHTCRGHAFTVTLDLPPIASRSLDSSYGLNSMHVAASCVLIETFGTAICRARNVCTGGWSLQAQEHARDRSKVKDHRRTHAHSREAFYRRT